MNKKLLFKLIFSIAIIIVVVLIWLLVSSSDSWKNNLQQNGSGNLNQNITAQEAADWSAPFMKEIKIEFIEQEELNKMGLANDPNAQLQVLERDANGNVMAYKKIYKEEDIIKYKYDPESTIVDGGVASSTTNASGTSFTN